MSMTESEAIRRLKDHFRVHDDGRPTPHLDEAVSMAISSLEEIQQLHAIGTVSEFAELKEKATPKKPIVRAFKASYENKHYQCPTCGKILISKIDGSWCGGTLSKNCEECGTALDWSEGKE